MFNRKAFFDPIRRDFGSFSQEQVDGFSRILDEWERRGGGDVRHLAYMLATVWHETAATMQPIVERGSQAYLRSKKYWPWIGRGLVQLTWEENYRKFGIARPEQACEWPTALRILFDGMRDGSFTGKKLSHYFNATTDDPVNARRIVNALDDARLIAGYHAKFLQALVSASTAVPEPVTPVPPKPEPVEPIPPPRPVEPVPPPRPTEPTSRRPKGWLIGFLVGCIVGAAGVYFGLMS